MGRIQLWGVHQRLQQVKICRVNCSRAKSEPPLSTKAAQARDPAEKFACRSGRQQNQYRFGFGALRASFACTFKCIPLPEQANAEFKSLPNHGTPGAGALRETKQFVTRAVAVAAGHVCGCLLRSCLRARGSPNFEFDLADSLRCSSLLLRGCWREEIN